MFQGWLHVVDLPLPDRCRIWLSCPQCTRWQLSAATTIALTVSAVFSYAGTAAAIAAERRIPVIATSIAQVNLEDLEDFEYWERLCQLQASARQYEEAQQACEQAIEIRPEDAGIWAEHSGILLQLEKYPEAIASADLSLTYNIENSLAFTYQCMAFYALENYETALDKCNEALRRNGDWGNQSPALAWRYRGQILDEQGDTELALVAFERTLLLEPSDSLTLTYQCRALLNLERYPEAIQSCQDALTGNSEWGQENPGLAVFYEGLAHSRQGEYEAAIAAYDRSIALDPNNADTWTQQGWVLEQFDQPTEALTSYTRAIEIAPEFSQALVGQCTMLNQLGQYETALASCQQAIQGDGQWWPIGPAQAWSEQAQALAGTGALEEALASSNRAIGIRPDYSEAWNNQSVILWYLGQQQESLEARQAYFVRAARAAQQAISLNPEASRPYASLGRILQSQGQLLADVQELESAIATYESALTAYKESLDRDELDAETWVNYSAVLWLSNRFDEALDAAEQAIRVDVTASQAWQNRGAVLVALGRYGEAQGSYERAISLDEQNAAAWASLGIIQVQLGQLENGQAALEQALALDPEQPLAKRAIEELAEAM
ncbi:MAG: tetratricopeptide repeat protein [Cyanobacteria bacterium J06638_20]